MTTQAGSLRHGGKRREARRALSAKKLANRKALARMQHELLMRQRLGDALHSCAYEMPR